MSAATELNVAKRNLAEALGDNMKIYLGNLKSWFKQKMTKEDFDLEARRLLKTESAHLHNEFLLAIMTKCQILSSSIGPKDITSSTQNTTAGKPTKRKDPKLNKSQGSRSSFPHRFAPANPMMYVPQAVPRATEDDPSLGFCSRELTLPEESMVHGRMFVGAWENELDDVTNDSVKLVMHAVEHHIKTILTAVLSRRNGYKLRESRFKFAMGARVKNPYIRQSLLIRDFTTQSEATSISSAGHQMPTLRPSPDLGEEDAARQISAAVDTPETRGPITLFDLLEALQMYKDSIPSHTVYATNMERIIHRLWHPSQDELDQEIIHKQEMLYKQETNNHHLPIRF